MANSAPEANAVANFGISGEPPTDPIRSGDGVLTGNCLRATEPRPLPVSCLALKRSLPTLTRKKGMSLRSPRNSKEPDSNSDSSGSTCSSSARGNPSKRLPILELAVDWRVEVLITDDLRMLGTDSCTLVARE